MKTIIIQNITTTIYNQILKFNAPSATWNFDYWRGYCNAIEEAYTMPKNEIWNAVKDHMKILCNKYKQQ